MVCSAFLGLLSCCSSWGRLWLFYGAFMPSRIYVHASYKRGLCCLLRGLRDVLRPAVSYSVVARSGGFPGAFGAFWGYGPRLLLSAFYAAFKGAADPPEYISQWWRVPCILGAFWVRLRAFRASAGICSGFP